MSCGPRWTRMNTRIIFWALFFINIFRTILVYDPCMGSASLLLGASRFSGKPEYIRYYGQELIASTYNLARMNMFLHHIAPENQHLHHGDTLNADWPTTEETEFDMVTMNPPYSAKWSAAQGFLSDARFSDYGVLAPKSKADYAFLLHGFYHLKPTGTMAIVLHVSGSGRGKDSYQAVNKRLDLCRDRTSDQYVLQYDHSHLYRRAEKAEGWAGCIVYRRIEAV